jgi:hypothetical protein
MLIKRGDIIMKYLLILFAVLLLNPMDCYSQEPLDTTDKILFANFVLLKVIDVGQTNYALTKSNFHEANPLYGKDPSSAKLWAINAVGVGILYYCTTQLNSSERKYFLAFLNAFQLTVVGLNYDQPTIGLRIKF